MTIYRIQSLNFIDILTSSVYRRNFMKYLSTLVLATGLLATQTLASGCSEMAAFYTQVNNFLETANLTSDTKDKINTLSAECKSMHDLGMEVKNIDSCKEVMTLVKVY